MSCPAQLLKVLCTEAKLQRVSRLADAADGARKGREACKVQGHGPCIDHDSQGRGYQGSVEGVAAPPPQNTAWTSHCVGSQ